MNTVVVPSVESEEYKKFIALYKANPNFVTLIDQVYTETQEAQKKEEKLQRDNAKRAIFAYIGQASTIGDLILLVSEDPSVNNVVDRFNEIGLIDLAELIQHIKGATPVPAPQKIEGVPFTDQLVNYIKAAKRAVTLGELKRNVLPTSFETTHYKINGSKTNLNNLYANRLKSLERLGTLKREPSKDPKYNCAYAWAIA